MKKFLVINPFGIGDVLFTTPAIKAIKKSDYSNIIGYWCNERVEPILKNNPHVDKIFSLSRGDIKKIYRKSKLEGIKRFWSLFYRIRGERFDISLDFSLDHRYSLISKFLGIKRRIGYNFKKRGRFLTDKIDIDGYQDKHIVEYYLELLKLLNIQLEDRRLELFPAEEGIKQAANLLQGVGLNSKDLLIGIAPGAGASWGKDAFLKHWPVGNFAQLADRLMQDLGAKILILGDTSERSLIDIMMNTMRSKSKSKPIDLVGKASLEELIAVMNKLNIVVSNDGGLLHIAVALGKKTVSFFGPVDPKVYGPYPPDSKRHIVLRKSLECSPCYRHFRLFPCERNRQCLEEIDIEEAFKAITYLLN